MSCPDEELLSAYADGESDETETAAVERHLTECASCRRLVDETREMGALGRSALAAIPVEPRSARTLCPPAARGLRLPRAVLLAAAASILLILSAAAFFHTLRMTDQPPRKMAVEDTASFDRFYELVKRPEADARPGDAFERWAQVYRRQNIPLIPMEELANYSPREELPAYFRGRRTNGTN